MNNSYKFLGWSVLILKVLAFLAVIVGIVSSIVIFVGGGTPEAPKVTGFLGLLLGVIYFFLFFTVSEVIRVLLDIAKKLESKSTNV